MARDQRTIRPWPFTTMAHESLEDDPLQAVVLCDVFDQRFSPLTLEGPRCLMPVCNVPLLEWTLETLASAGVHEVFLLATWHVPVIRAYLEEHHPMLVRPPARGAVSTTALAKVTLIAVPEARSIGDAMREIDAHQVIKSDFVLIHGDAVGNMDLSAVIAAHKQRRQVDRNAIMTICTMSSAVHSRARRQGDLSIFTLAPRTSQLLHYASVPAVPRKKQLKLPLELFESAGHGVELDVRNDLVDCGVDICSIDVPPLFTENFDYQLLRREFVQGILTSDLLEAKIFVHVAPMADASAMSSGEPWSSRSGGVLGTPTYGTGYMLRVSDPRRMDAASRDILAGWTYPYTPRLGLPGGAKYTAHSCNRYLGARAYMASSAYLGHRSMLGTEARLEAHSEVHQSVLGARVVVGERSQVRDSFLFDDVHIGHDCTVTGAILGRRVQVLNGVHLHRGTIVGEGCVVGPQVTLPVNAHVSMQAFRAAEDDSDGEEVAESKADAALGSASRGYLWTARPGHAAADSEDEDEEELDELERPANAALFSLGADLSVIEFDDAYSELSSINADSEPEMDSELDESDESDLSAPDSSSGFGSYSLTLPAGTESQTLTEKLESEQRLCEFRAEAHASLERAFEERHEPENAAIELKTLRMASNVPPGEVRRVVIEFLLGHCSVDHAKETADLLDHWGSLITEVAQDDQVEALAVMQVRVAEETDARPIALCT